MEQTGPYNMFQNRISDGLYVCWICFFYVVGTVTLWQSDCEEWKCLIRRAPVVSYAVGTERRFKLNEQLDQRSVSVLVFRAGAQTQTPGKNPSVLQNTCRFYDSVDRPIKGTVQCVKIQSECWMYHPMSFPSCCLKQPNNGRHTKDTFRTHSFVGRECI